MGQGQGRTQRVDGCERDLAHAAGDRAGNRAVPDGAPNERGDTSSDQSTAVAATAACNQSEVEQHLPLVGHIVFQLSAHFPHHVDREELSRAGALGLVEAARRYDPERGVPFARYAAQRIRGAILDALRDADWAPRSLRTASRRVETARQAFIHEMGRSPSVEELGTATGLSPAELCRLEARVFRSVVLTLDEVVSGSDQEDLALVDVLADQRQPAPHEGVEDMELRSYLRDAVHLLPERHRLVVIGYFLEGRTSRDLARFLSVTESRISQLRAEALEMLRDGIGAQYDTADGETVQAPAPAGGRVARRKAAYAAAIADKRSWKSRVTMSSSASPSPNEPSLRPLSGPQRQSQAPAGPHPAPGPIPVGDLDLDLDLRTQRPSKGQPLEDPTVALAAS
ncbi:MAG: sigma-70 family RNA polymerase sigma factor [Acidimicrobiales bacterium]